MQLGMDVHWDAHRAMGMWATSMIMLVPNIDLIYITSIYYLYIY